MMALKMMICLLLVITSTALADIEVNSTRKSGYDYACIDVSGSLLSSHQRFDKAQASCVERALNDPDGVYEVQGGRWRVSVNVEPTTPPPVSPPTDPNIFFLVNVACVPNLEGIEPLSVFDMAQCITGPGAYTVSVDAPWTVNDTTIAAPASGSGSMNIILNFDEEDVEFSMSRLWSIAP